MTKSSAGAVGAPPTPPRTSAEVVLAGHRLRLTADSPETVDKALAVLVPPCAIAAPVASEPGWSVHIARAPAGGALQRKGHPVFGWPGVGRQLEIVDAANGLLVLAGRYREGCAEALLEVDAGRRRTQVFLPSGDGPSRRWPDWVGRMFFATRLLADGWHLVHASAVAVDTDAGPRAVVFLAGPHGGKSTLAHRASVELSAKFLSDDLVFLRPCSDSVIAVGWPTRVSVPPELVDVALRQRAPSAVAPDSLAGSPRRNRLVLSPPEYAAMFDVERAGPTPVGAVVVVSPTGTASFGRHGLEIDGKLSTERLQSALMVAVQIPAQRLMMLDLLGVAGPPSQPPGSMEKAQAELLAGLCDRDVAAVGVSVPDMSRLPSLPVWDALAGHLPWIMGSTP